MMNRLKYAGKGIIVDCETRNIVSPRAVVEAYNRLACVLRDTNALVDDLRTTLKTALDALCYLPSANRTPLVPPQGVRGVRGDRRQAL